MQRKSTPQKKTQKNEIEGQLFISFQREEEQGNTQT